MLCRLDWPGGCALGIMQNISKWIFSVNLDYLFECWRLEVSNKKKAGRRISLLFNVLRRARKDNKLRFLFAFRLAQYFSARGGVFRRHARRMQQRLNRKYAVDIDIGAQIAPGLRIGHLPGVVITRHR